MERALGSVAIVDIGPREVAKFLTERAIEASGPTANRSRAMLSKLLSLAVDWGYISSNPVSRVKPYRENPPRIRYLTTEEAERLLTACDSAWLRLIVTAALLTAARKGELLRLDWSEIDLGRGLVTFLRTKNGGNRTIPLHSTLRQALESLADREGAVFRGVNGLRLGRWTVRHAFDRAVKKAGLAPFRFHDCRHAAVSFIVQAGVSLAIVQAIGGWKTVSMVNRYAHLQPQHLKGAIDALPELKVTPQESA